MKTTGKLIWWSGMQVRVTSEPFTLHGGRFVDAEDVETGKGYTVKAEYAL